MNVRKYLCFAARPALRPGALLALAGGPQRLAAAALALLASALLLSVAPAKAGQPQLDLPRMQLQAGLHLITAQVARTPEQLSLGLMWRRTMPANEGMWFVFDAPATQCFWMKNTFLPLTAAFVADDGRIVNLADMEPLSQRSHCSAEPVRYVLEMHRGWFAERGIGAGMRLRGGPFVGAPSIAPSIAPSTAPR
ncbi:MAG: hypothetical protein C0441_06535 [Comamonadaceae bacterium]|nr:hypothetical protein [Comamonadaceae bacterium]